MIRVTFFTSGETLAGYHITGHSDYSEEGSDIVCAAVSSAVYMTANTVTDILGLNPELSVSDGDMRLVLKTAQETAKAADILSGFQLHIAQLAEQYPQYINVTITEV